MNEPDACWGTTPYLWAASCDRPSNVCAGRWSARAAEQTVALSGTGRDIVWKSVDHLPTERQR